MPLRMRKYDYRSCRITKERQNDIVRVPWKNDVQKNPQAVPNT